MKISAQQLYSAIEYATSNVEALRESEQAACYYCMKIYSALEVVEFIPEENTAICPKCGIDSVLPGTCGIEFSEENLNIINDYYF